MEHSIRRVAVLGAGTMGAAIAAHVANAGLPVLLLDMPPRELTAKEEKKGLTLDRPEVRNRIAEDGLARAKKIKPVAFMSRRAEQLVEIGNFDDHLDRLAEADWIVEAVIENAAVKRRLLARVDEVRRPGSLVTTNTSGLPIASIAEGRSPDFRQHFFGTHFFNPPRYMRLVEIIRGDEADPLAVSSLAELIVQKLGKGVVFCKDTPNFIGNRILAIHGAFVMEVALDLGYRFEEADAVTGPLIGRPKTATFRLQDLVGIDVAHFVADNLYDLIPEDFYRRLLKAPQWTKVVSGLVERGRLGNKTGAGFYRKTRGGYEVLDPETFDYQPQQEVAFESVAAVAGIADLGERLRALFADERRDQRGAELAWAAVRHFLAYAAEVAEEVAYDLAAIDNAVRWGFAHELGPFELWDRLGVAETAERMEASGIEVADWVKEMMFAEIDSFYRVDDDGRVAGYYDWHTKSYADLPPEEHHVRVEELRRTGEPVAANRSASLFDMGDGVLLLEFHSKMNAIDEQMIEMMAVARRQLEGDAFYGLVIGNDGKNFSVGANLKEVGEAALGGDFDGIRAGSRALQQALSGLRYGSKPVVAAVHGMALGGGAEIALGASRIVAHAESYIGLVESGVGLVPAGGGLKELVRRSISKVMEIPEADPLPAAQKILETVALGKVSSSAAEGADWGFASAHDRVVMHRDHLLDEAKQEVLAMVAEGHLPPPPARLYAGGRDLYAALKIWVWSMQQAGYASDHDVLVAEKIAYVVAGGELSAPQWVSEEYFLELEREAFAELAATAKTQERIRHMLETGKPLRN
ncbi:MAG: 3-hydroxyacyl-CoA dehydrogenase/enoyl-CoA hydratase family protein [Thermoanaerobaculia bacterium]